MESILDVEFPIWALLPTKETGVTTFLQKYPSYDGRGTVIAIFDSGVDPGAPGLQVTSDGQHKVIDRLDCSGAGDVDTSTIVKADDDGFITGLTGRKLKVPSKWTNPTGDYHIGIKNAYELYPGKLKERIFKERKEKLWDPLHKKAVAEVSQKLQGESKQSTPTTCIDKLKKEDIKIQLDLLSQFEKKYVDCGPTYDCVVFHDGDLWRACIDTTEKGDLASCHVLGIYRETFDYAPLTTLDQFNYSINVYSNGNVLEIVGMCSSHGTHVASIAASNFPDHPEKNGVAPGAQIVSLTIGDSRLGSMETGTALVRGMIYVMQQAHYRIDLINMSYGEHSHWSNAGRLGDLMNEVVSHYGVVWISSAGNHGPALSTIGTPPDINTNSVMGIGAYVSPEMMVAEYSLREKIPGMPYTWSSRGPTADGDRGVSVCAPGGAITSVPNFTLRCSQLMNGTSMAAPHVAGAVALLISGMKALGIKFSPYSIRRAVENTAQHIDSIDNFAQGHGLIQVDRAFDHLKDYCTQPERDVRFQIVTCNNNKGIYIRGGNLDRPKEHSISVEPCFMTYNEGNPEEKINFNIQLALTCSSPWIRVPSHLDLTNLSRVFAIKIDPSGLAPGAHITSVKAYDVNCPNKGFVFEVPITVLKPDMSFENSPRPDIEWKNVQFANGSMIRHFAQVPDGATWGILRIQTNEKDKAGRFVIHVVQLQPFMKCKSLEYYKMINLHEQGEQMLPFSVKGGMMLELVLAKWWANMEVVTLDYQLSFYGIKPESQEITMHGSEGIYRLEVTSALRHEDIAPVVTLKNQVMVLRPTDYLLAPLTSRDIIPKGRQIYELVLTYNFQVSKATDLMPNSSLLSDLLYESEFESQLWMLFDVNKQLIGTGDAFPSKYVVKVEKGDYNLLLQVRHEKRDLLEKMTDLVLLMNQKLATNIFLDVYPSHSQAILGGKKMGVTNVPQGTTCPIYIAPLSSEKPPPLILRATKFMTGGQYVLGTITFPRDEWGKKVDTYQFKYVLPEPPKKGTVVNRTNTTDGNKEKEKPKIEEFHEAIRDAKIGWINKLDASTHGLGLYTDLRTSFPDHVPILLSRMQALDAEKEKNYHLIIETANLALKILDQTQLLAYYGMKSDARPDNAKTKSLMDKQKALLVETLSRKGLAMIELYESQLDGAVDKSHPAVVLDDIDELLWTIMKFVDVADSKAINFVIRHAEIHKCYGQAIKLLFKQQDDCQVKEVEERIVTLFKQHGWDHCAHLFGYSMSVKFPPAYHPF